MEEQDYFFAPRPKLSWQAHLIRVCAAIVCLALGLAFFFPVYMQYRMHLLPQNRVELGDDLVQRGSAELLILLPLWRCYLLRRWACVLVGLVFLGLALAICAGAFDGSGSGEAIGEGIVATPLALIFLWLVVKEWPRLKSGF